MRSPPALAFPRGRLSSSRKTCRRRRDRRDDGAMLIIALGVLTLLAILGAAFATLIRLEKKATDNYLEAKRMNFLLDSAVDRVIAELQGAKNFRSYTYYKDSPWLYVLKDRAGEGDLAHGRVEIDDDRVGKWEIFAERGGQNYSYKTKVIDCSSQINLNGRQDTLARMLDNLGIAIEGSDRLKIDRKTVWNPFFTKPRKGGTRLSGAEVVNFRRRLPGARFTSKNQLMQLIGIENFEILKDFLTVSSWEDPYTYKPVDGDEEVPDQTAVAARGGGGRGVGGGNQGQTQATAYSPSSRISEEPRHPININTAPEEVLIACLQGLAGRRIFPFSKLGAGGSMVPADQGSTSTGEKLIGVNEESRDVTPRAVFVYSPSLEYTHAKKIADRIIARRKQAPFMAWRTNDQSQPGFEDFIDQLDASFFPGPEQCLVIDPEQPQNTVAENAIIKSGGASLLGRMWVRGHGTGGVRAIRGRLGLAVHDTYAWYYDMMKSVLKANFNPNTRINRYNPNGPAYIPVDKSDLVWARDRFNLLKGYTTEFCFDTNGIYEVEVLGRISGKGGQGRTAVAGAPASDPLEQPFDRRMRTVVKVFEVLRHTNQLHFEKTFVSGSRSSKDRKFVLTYPDPMAALTELTSGGSDRDGRVELAGLLDGIRLEMPIQVRTQSYGTNPSIAMAHGFQDRDMASVAKLRQEVTGGASPLNEGRVEILRDVLDAPFSRQRSTNRRILRRKDLVNLGVYKNPSALPGELDVKKEIQGTDLFPDGINTSLLRMSHLGSKVLFLPARQRIGEASSGGGNTLVGASGLGTIGQNVLGNVPYHHGGIAFWVKFEFNGDDPVFSGLIGCTQVIKEVVPAASDYTGSEGTQFFIFKNSEGRLRIVRMYYHQAFPEGGGEGGDTTGEPILYPKVDVAQAGGDAAANQQNPITEHLDQKKIVSRSDIVLDVSHFQAHEWHHIAVDWNDEDTANPIRLYLDFQDTKEVARKAQDPSSLGSPPSSWVRLNERQPKDGLHVAGFVREQGVAEYGAFKWFTNSTDRGKEGGGVAGVIQTVAQSVKRVLANATIDELVTYEGKFPSVKTYYGGAGSPGYFTQQVGEYLNVFEVPLPPDVDQVTLRSFDWTCYYPTLYTDSRPNSVPQQLQALPIECDLQGSNFEQGTSPPAAFRESWRTPQIVNQVAGKRIVRRADLTRGNKADLVYNFKMTGAKFLGVGNTTGGVVQTPAIDDVTLTYFLPNPKILLQEEVD